MGTDKRERQKQGRQARVEAAQQAQRKAAARRRVVTIASVVVVAAVVVGVFAWYAGRDSGDETVTADTTTSTTPATSAAGLPCVPLADPLPAGAPDVPITPGPPPDTLVTEDLVVGTGAEVPTGAPSTEVTVNYIGVSCSTGAIFDSSYSRGQPATFALDGVIPGWTEGIPGMKVGGQRLLVIPPDMAYGASGRPGIAPDETLYFVVELVDVPAASENPNAEPGGSADG
jgi:hypothetical protein